MKTLSIVIPTISRPTLAATLASIAAQSLVPGDEILLIGDGPQPEAERMFSESGLPGKYIEGPMDHDWGGPQRNIGMRVANGDLLAFMDDDDTYLPGAFDLMRTADSESLNIFRMQCRGRLLWMLCDIRVGNVSTQMLVVPNLPGVGHWTRRYVHDYDFAAMAANRFRRIAWRKEPIAVSRPTSNLAWNPS